MIFYLNKKNKPFKIWMLIITTLFAGILSGCMQTTQIEQTQGLVSSQSSPPSSSDDSEELPTLSHEAAGDIDNNVKVGVPDEFIEPMREISQALDTKKMTCETPEYRIISKEFVSNDINERIKIKYPYIEFAPQLGLSEIESLINTLLFESSFCEQDFSEDNLSVANITYRIMQATDTVLSIQFYGYRNYTSNIPLNYSITLDPNSGTLYSLADFYSNERIKDLLTAHEFVPLRTETFFFDDQMFSVYENYANRNATEHIHDFFVADEFIGIAVSVPIAYGSILNIYARKEPVASQRDGFHDPILGKGNKKLSTA